MASALKENLSIGSSKSAMVSKKSLMSEKPNLSNTSKSEPSKSYSKKALFLYLHKLIKIFFLSNFDVSIFLNQIKVKKFSYSHHNYNTRKRYSFKL